MFDCNFNPNNLIVVLVVGLLEWAHLSKIQLVLDRYTVLRKQKTWDAN